MDRSPVVACLVERTAPRPTPRVRNQHSRSGSRHRAVDERGPSVKAAAPRRAREAPARRASQQGKISPISMMTRTTTASVAGRSVAMRRMRRRASTASRPYCSTNGCTSYLVVDPDTNVATCPVCGFTRHMH
jgi:hypothetical protein